MELSLSHWSNNKIEELKSGSGFDESRYDKPKGLWVSVDDDDDWPQWNELNGFLDRSTQYQYQVTLKKDHDVLILNSYEDIEAFSDMFDMFHEGYPWSWQDRRYRGLNWKEIGRLWQGIVIAPFSYKARRLISWYWGWDCESGCIWNMAAIEGLALVREPFTVTKKDL